MTVTMNRAALTADIIRSVALGPLDSIAHPLAPESYAGEVWLGDEVVGTFTIDVTEGGDGEQVDIDLSEIAGRKGGHGAGFVLGLFESQPAFAVFHCGGNALGFHVVLRSRSESAPYDTRLLQPGDYYIVIPVKPGRYAMAASEGMKGKGVLTVEQARPTDKPRASAFGAKIVVKGDFEPAEARVVSGDGVVFEIAAPDIAILLTLEKPVRASEPRRPVGIRFPGRRI